MELAKLAGRAPTVLVSTLRVALTTPVFAGPLGTPSPSTTATSTPSPSPTAAPTATPTPSASPDPTSTATGTPTATPTPTPSATSTATPTASATATPTSTPPPSLCAATWPLVTVASIGKGQNASNNFKVFHFITGNISNPASLDIKATRIFVCRGTSVDITIADSTGVPTNSAKTTGISCTPTGCTISNLQSTQRYNSTSADGRDKDGMQIVPTDD